MRKLPVILIAMTGLLAGCISGKPPVDSYTSPTTGKTTVFQSDKEMCESACNDDYTRCMETAPAGQDSIGGSIPGVPQATPGAPAGMFGASADCRRDLQKCLPGCKSR